MRKDLVNKADIRYAPVSRVYFRSILLICLSLSIIPLAFKFTGLATYNYPYNVSALALWFLPLIGVYLFYLLAVAGTRNFEISAFAILAPPPNFLAYCSWPIALGYFYFSFYALIPSGISIFDIRGLYYTFGQFGDATFSRLGQVFNVLSPVIFLVALRAYAARVSGFFLWYAPTIIFVTCLLLTGKRQALIFIVFCLLGGWLLRQARITLRIAFRLMLSVALALVLMLVIGWLRSGFESLGDQLHHNSAFMSQEHRDGPFGFLGLFYLYLGGQIEVLSVATDHIEPLYKPFSGTSSFLLRRMNDFGDYFDYQEEFVTFTAEILRDYLGGFGRIWGGSNYELYVEGGYLWICLAFTIISSVYFRAIYLLLRGRLLVIDLMFLFSFSLHQFFVFPLRDQFVMFAYAYYLFWRIFVFNRQVLAARSSYRFLSKKHGFPLQSRTTEREPFAPHSPTVQAKTTSSNQLRSQRAVSNTRGNERVDFRVIFDRGSAVRHPHD